MDFQNTADFAAATAHESPLPSVDVVQRRLAFRYEPNSVWLMLPPSVDLELTLDAQCRTVPNTPPSFHGVINWRGLLVPVFDLLAWLNGRAVDVGLRRTLVVGKGQRAAALLSSGEPRIVTCHPVRADETEAAPALRRFLTRRSTTPDGPAYEFDYDAWLSEVGKLRDAAPIEKAS